LFHPDAVQTTGTIEEAADTASSAAAEPSEMQQRMALTSTFLSQESAAPSSGGAIGAPPAPAMAQAVPSTEITEAEANTGMAFAATQAPTIIFAPQTATAASMASPTLTATLAPTLTLTPSATMTHTALPTEVPTQQPSSTPVPLVVQPNNVPGDSVPLVLIVLGVVFLLIAIATTIIRRRNRS